MPSARPNWPRNRSFLVAATMQAGTLGPQQPVVGGGMGLRYIIRGTAVVEYASNDGPLLIDSFSTVPVSPEQLKPKESE